jgi:hypothetical protein
MISISFCQAQEVVDPQEVVDLFSSIESCDVAVLGEADNSTLQVDLRSAGGVLQSRSFSIDGPGTWIARWEAGEAEEGSYSVCARLLKDGRSISERCYSFYYGGQVPVRFDVRDFNADSRGIRMSISSSDPTIVDIYYMLISGERALYLYKDEAVQIPASPSLQIDQPWRQVLENGREYSGRVKIVEPSHNQTRAIMRSFVAKDDARMTETYEDETGASATVMGNSRVPFEGSLRFVLSRNGMVLAEIEKRTPVLLAGKDETVEISWNKTLDPGLYQLQVVLLGKKGDVKDVRESVIEAKPASKPAPLPVEKKSPSSAGIAVASLIAALLLRGRDH